MEHTNIYLQKQSLSTNERDLVLKYLLNQIKVQVRYYGR